MSETAAATTKLKLKNDNLNNEERGRRGRQPCRATNVVLDDQKTRSQLFGTKWKKIICNPPSGYKNIRLMQTLWMDFNYLKWHWPCARDLQK